MKVFDGHNDLLSRLWQRQEDPLAAFRADDGHINRDACAAGGFAGGFFAIYCPAHRRPSGLEGLFEDGQLEEPLPDPLDAGWAASAALGQAGIARRLQDAGEIEIVTDATSLRRAFEGSRIACVLHLEGAEPIDRDLLALDTLYAAGLRSLGPVWSRPNIFGHGVPFAHMRDGDTGPGLTEDGKRLAAHCVELGIMLDVSHIALRGFQDIADLGKPVIATHSNAHALCQSSRNLTDDQMSIIAQTGGVAGFNFEPAFISETGWKTGAATLDDCIRQLDYMLEKLGEDTVALGSDFDGARTPDGITSAADLPVLIAAMERAGYGAPLIEKICHGNWLSFLTRHFGET